MCGIPAIFSYSPDAPPADQAEVLAIRERKTENGERKTEDALKIETATAIR
jgi:hypothetical protein